MSGIKQSGKPRGHKLFMVYKVSLDLVLTSLSTSSLVSPFLHYTLAPHKFNKYLLNTLARGLRTHWLKKADMAPGVHNIVGMIVT
jgi:hypothetical protein